ncbi:hypothetical protein TNCV_3563351 [Trichonephila clavipes]|nr:hypothetical protein TNCV_3563351 [Trichonephila clavipes]
MAQSKACFSEGTINCTNYQTSVHDKILKWALVEGNNGGELKLSPALHVQDSPVEADQTLSKGHIPDGNTMGVHLFDFITFMTPPNLHFKSLKRPMACIFPYIGWIILQPGL